MKYKYGFKGLNKKDAWTVESDGEAASETNRVPQQHLDENLLSDRNTSVIHMGISELNHESFQQIYEIDEVLQTKEDVEFTQRYLARKHSKSDILFNGKYFIMLSKSDKGIEAKCCHCRKIKKGYGTSTSNFLSHLRIVSS